MESLADCLEKEISSWEPIDASSKTVKVERLRRSGVLSHGQQE